MNWRKPIIYTLLYLSGSKIPLYLSKMRAFDRRSLEDQNEIQKLKIKKVLLHAWENVPYYRKILEECGAVRSGKICLKNFEKIPILTKEIIRREGKNLLSKDYKKRNPYINTSGGSTGEPISFIQDKQYDDWNKANKIYYKWKAGQNIGEKELRLWGSEKDLLEGKESLKIRLRNWLYNRKEFNAFKMSEEEMFFFAKKLNDFSPSWIEAYAQPIYEFARFIDKKKLKIKSPPNGILTSAGTLYSEMKNTIARVFRCEVYNRYGSREVGDIACSDGTTNGLRLSFWNNYLEILNNSRIYITNLNNYSMPFIRYEIGDIGEKGANWSYLNKIEGREMSVFKTKDGKIIPAEFFIHFVGVIYNKGYISKFQVIQEDYHIVKIKVVLRNKEEFNKNKLNIENSIKNVMSKECEIVWEIVDNIESLTSGKFLYTMSKIK